MLVLDSFGSSTEETDETVLLHFSGAYIHNTQLFSFPWLLLLCSGSKRNSKEGIQFIDCNEKFFDREQKHPKDLRLLVCTDSAAQILHRVAKHAET